MSSVTVGIKSDGLILHGTEMVPETGRIKTAVLFLHGGGTAHSGRYTPWQDYLSRRGIASLAFDFRGVGQSQGLFEDGSLANRLRDACEAYDSFVKDLHDDSVRITIAGSSMGGHVACCLTGIRPSAGLILQSAAAYGSTAETLKLNDTFRTEIRQPDNFADSPAFESVTAYSGPVLCIYGKHDVVVPEAVKRVFLNRARKNGQACVIREYGHTMLSPQTPIEREGFRELLQVSYRFLKTV